MATLHLTLAGDIEPSEADHLAQSLRNHLDVEDPRFLVRKDEVGVILQFVQLIGDWVAWIPLGASVTAYLVRLGQRAADASWVAAQNHFKRKEIKPLADVATTLAQAKRAFGDATEIIVGLDIPEKIWGTVLIIREDDPVKIAYALAKFIDAAETISVEIKKEVAAGRAPLGRAEITLEADGGIIVRWQSQADFSRHEKRIK